MTNDKNNSNITIITITICLIIIISAVGLGYYYENTDFSPKPVLVSTRLYDDSTLLDYCITAKAVIRNDGADGVIILEVNAHQGKKTWTKTKRAFFLKKETKTLRIAFDEFKLFDDGKEHASFRVYPLE